LSANSQAVEKFLAEYAELPTRLFLRLLNPGEPVNDFASELLTFAKRTLAWPSQKYVREYYEINGNNIQQNETSPLLTFSQCFTGPHAALAPSKTSESGRPDDG
jgi:hypothetical protein